MNTNKGVIKRLLLLQKQSIKNNIQSNGINHDSIDGLLYFLNNIFGLGKKVPELTLTKNNCIHFKWVVGNEIFCITFFNNVKADWSYKTLTNKVDGTGTIKEIAVRFNNIFHR